jgi:hypothetical protein
MSTHTATLAAPRSSRSALLALPLVLLVAAAIVTNLGGGLTRDAHAATVNVNGSLGSDKHLATNICTGASTGETSGPSAGAGGTIDFGTMVANTAYVRSCTIGFGSTNSATVNMQVNAASATFGWTGFAAQGACSAPVGTTSKVGIDSAASAGGTTNAAIDCVTAGQYQSIPTAATTACSVTGQTTDANCVLTVSVTTGAATAGSVSNSTLTVNAA